MVTEADHPGMEEVVEHSLPDTSQESPTSAVLVPPSIHHDELLSGISYAHYTAVPTLITPSNIFQDRDNGTSVGTECVLGVDEAGRGPVIGPMVYGAFYLPLELHHSLLSSTYHFDDSKALTPIARANLTKALCTEGTDLHQSCGWAIKSLSARDIGAGMLKHGGSYNLNAQAMDATIEIIKAVICKGVNICEIYIDTIGSPAVYQKRLERVFPSIKICVEKKADSLYPCVSAASVVAKVTRDASCEVLYQEYERQSKMEEKTADDGDWGSGYPSDARCTRWLKAEMDTLFGWGNECRFSWGTVKDLLEVKGPDGMKIDWRQEEDDDENMRVSDFFNNDLTGHNNTETNQLKTWFGRPVGQEAFQVK